MRIIERTVWRGKMEAVEEKGVHRGNGVAEKEEGGREGWKVGYSKKQ